MNIITIITFTLIKKKIANSKQHQLLIDCYIFLLFIFVLE